MGSLSFLQWIFPTQESNSGLPHCRRILYELRYQGSLILIYVGYEQHSSYHPLFLNSANIVNVALISSNPDPYESSPHNTLIWAGLEQYLTLATKEPCKRSTFCFLSVLPPTFFFFLPNLLENVNLSFSGGEGKGGLFVGLFLCTRLVMGAWPCRGAAGVTPLHRLAKQGAERIRVVQPMMPSQASLALQPVSSVRPAAPPPPCPLS